MKRMQIVCVILMFSTLLEAMNEKEKKAEIDRLSHLGKKAYKKGHLKLAQFYFEQAECEQNSIDFQKLNCMDEEKYELNSNGIVDMPKELSAMNEQGIEFCKQHNFYAAEQCFTTAINKGSKKGIPNLGLLFILQKKFPEAETYLIQGMKLGYRSLLPMLEKACKEQNKYIVEILSKEFDDDYAACLLNELGMTYYANKEFSQAEKRFIEAMYKGSMEAVNNLGMVYESCGHQDKAKLCYEIAINKGNCEAVDNLRVLLQNLDCHEELDVLLKKIGSTATH